MLNFPGSGGESKCGGGARERVDGADAPQEVNLLPDSKTRPRKRGDGEVGRGIGDWEGKKEELEGRGEGMVSGKIDLGQVTRGIMEK